MTRDALPIAGPRRQAGACPVSPLKPHGREIILDPATTLIRVGEVSAIVGLARPTIYKLLRTPGSDFPRPVPLSTSTARGAPVAWVLAEVQAWVRARIAARGEAAA
jgi:prophage regulatory protein